MTSRSSTSQQVAVASTSGPSPMSATSMSPASVGPAPSNRPGLNEANVTVATAGSAPPPLSTSPVKPDRPEGMSTARTGARPGRGGE